MTFRRVHATEGRPETICVGKYSVFVIERVAQLSPHIDAWSKLAACTSAPNLYYSPDFLIPNLTHIEHRPFVLLLIYEKATTNTQTDTLIGFAPFTVRAPTPRRPFNTLESFANRYVFSVHPLIDDRYIAEAWSVLLQVLRDPSHCWQLTDLRCECEPGGAPPEPVHQLLPSLAISCRKGVAQAWLHKPFTFDDFLNGLSSKVRRNYRRALRRLGDLGDVQFHFHRRCENVTTIIGDFLALERSGWKGMDGGAMATEASDSEFLYQIARNINAHEGLHYIELRLDGRLIAISLAHTQGPALFAFKLAYDEEFTRLSPGVLVAIETIRRFIADPNLTAAHAGNSVESWVQRYYTHSRESVSLHVPTRRPLPLAFVSALKCFNQLRGVETEWELGTRHTETR